MAFFGLFSSISGTQVDEFAKGLAREFAGQLPPNPAPETPAPSAPTPRKLWIACEGVFAKALAYRREHQLGVYKKARLGNSFRWELEALGYEKPFAEELTRRLVLHIAGKR